MRVLLQSTRDGELQRRHARGRAHARPGRARTASRREASRRSTCSAAAGRRIATFTAPLQVPAGDGAVQLGGVRRATAALLEFRPAGSAASTRSTRSRSRTTCAGVVARESPSSWPTEALKAQAVAARTYAITTSKAGAGFDQYADTRSQVYGGVAAETPSTNAAVAATRGQVVTYDGEPVVTYFFSTSGGRTENVENTNARAPSRSRG